MTKATKETQGKSLNAAKKLHRAEMKTRSKKKGLRFAPKSLICIW
jgi:hypothetical protein